MKPLSSILPWLGASLVAILVFTGLGLIHTRVVANGMILQDTADRLRALETNKAPATAKRWTSDHGLATLRCLRLPYGSRAREACLQTVEVQFPDSKDLAK